MLAVMSRIAGLSGLIMTSCTLRSDTVCFYTCGQIVYTACTACCSVLGDLMLLVLYSVLASVDRENL